MNIITVILFESIHEMEEALHIALYDMDVVNEDYNYCISRERGHELIKIRESGLPYIAAAKKPIQFNDTGIKREEKQTLEILEVNFDINGVEKDKCRILCRGFNAFDGAFGIEPLLSKEDDLTVKRWAETLDSEDVGRNVRIVDQETVKSIIFADDYEPIFVKTFDKGTRYNTLNSIIGKGGSVQKSKGLSVIPTEMRPDLDREGQSMTSYLSKEESSVLTLFRESYEAFNPWHGENEKYPAQYRSIDGEMVISPIINIQNDDHGKLEYRVFVVNGSISSISRYLDYAKVDIPKEIADTADRFIKKYCEILPKYYVVDFAQTDKGVELVELNPYERSGRYFQNSATAMFSDLSSAFSCTIETNNSKCLVPEQRKKIKLRLD